MKADIYTSTGTKTSKKVELPKEYFEAEGAPQVLAQYVRVYLINQRRGTAKTKTRGEVAGGGRKPWRQKGTGRARHGSTRSPIWRGGGIAHGPTLRVFEAKMPKRMRRMALSLALSLKKEDVVVVRDLNLKEGRTKEILPLIEKLSLPRGTLFISKDRNDLLKRAVANLGGKVLHFPNLNPYEVLRAKRVVVEMGAWEGEEKLKIKNSKLKMKEDGEEKRRERVESKREKGKKTSVKSGKKSASHAGESRRGRSVSKSARAAKIRRNQRPKK